MEGFRRNSDSGGGFRGGSGGFRGGGGGFRGGNRGGGFRRSFSQERTKIKCASCGKEDEVPFKPREGSEVFCRDCFNKKRDDGSLNRAPQKRFEKKEESVEAEEGAEEMSSAEDSEGSE